MSRGALWLMLALACSCGGKSVCGPTRATVKHVIDGDTIELESGEKIRYLLINAPETTLGHDDCYGQQAADFNTQQVDGKTVDLAYDDANCKDKYGRLLAYVTIGTVDLNKAMVEQGYACVDYIPPAGTSRHQEFDDAEAVAKSNRVGLWGTCNPVTCE